MNFEGAAGIVRDALSITGKKDGTKTNKSGRGNYP